MRYEPGKASDMDVQTERLAVDVLDRALLDVQGSAALSHSEVIDLLLDLRTAVDDIALVECLEFDPSSSDRQRRFLHGRYHRRSVLARG